MSKEPEQYAYPSPDVVWAVEPSGVRLINRGSGSTLCLQYPEAALWDFVSRRVHPPESLRMYASVAGISPAEADVAIKLILTEWTDKGWLVN
jgi:hypothetical protein